MKQIEAVIFDWAGTTVDYGCMAPIHAMQQAFQEKNLVVSIDEIREPMGMLKIEHIQTVLEMERVKTNFLAVHGRAHEQNDVQEINQQFEKHIFGILHQHAELIDGMLNVQDYLRSEQIKIGSTTGYTTDMINVVAQHAAQQGYVPDHIVAADQVSQGRPYPYMLQRNLAALGIQDARKVVKVGDTIVDIQEGLYAGCYAVGIVQGSSMLGLTADEVNEIDAEDLLQRMLEVKYTMLAAGAHYVLDHVSELPWLIDLLQHRPT